MSQNAPSHDRFLDFHREPSVRVEAPITSVETLTLPLTKHGPITLHGGALQGVFNLPMTRVEPHFATLIDKVCRAIQDSGGLTVRSRHRQGGMRLLLNFDTMIEALSCSQTLNDRAGALAAQLQPFNINLAPFEPILLGSQVVLDLRGCDTEDAAQEAARFLGVTFRTKGVRYLGSSPAPSVSTVEVVLKETSIRDHLTCTGAGLCAQAEVWAYLANRGERSSLWTHLDQGLHLAMNQALGDPPYTCIRQETNSVRFDYQDSRTLSTLRAPKMVSLEKHPPASPSDLLELLAAFRAVLFLVATL